MLFTKSYVKVTLSVDRCIIFVNSRGSLRGNTYNNVQKCFSLTTNRKPVLPRRAFSF